MSLTSDYNYQPSYGGLSIPDDDPRRSFQHLVEGEDHGRGIKANRVSQFAVDQAEADYQAQQLLDPDFGVSRYVPGAHRNQLLPQTAPHIVLRGPGSMPEASSATAQPEGVSPLEGQSRETPKQYLGSGRFRERVAEYVGASNGGPDPLKALGVTGLDGDRFAPDKAYQDGTVEPKRPYGIGSGSNQGSSPINV